MAYQLELPPSLSTVHDIFHVLQLKKCLHVPTEVVTMGDQDLQLDLSYCEHPIRIHDEAERKTRCNLFKFLKVQWSNHTKDEATWDREDQLWADYLEFFSNI